MSLDKDLFSSPFSKFNGGFVDADVYFVADYFAEDLIGGAELTLEAIIGATKQRVQKYRCGQVSMELLHEIHKRNKTIIFGNWVSLNPECLQFVARNMKYEVVECDYKFCKYRSPEKHLASERIECDCHTKLYGQVVFAFLLGAEKIWWMSDKQRDRHEALFRGLIDVPNEVLSSVFDQDTLDNLKELSKNPKTDQWAILKSDSWIKGTDLNRQYCIDNGLPFVELGNMSYDDLLKTLSTCKGLVYLPLGGDTCPRLVIEAKLLGCELVLNEHVEHKNEVWFDAAQGADIETTFSYLEQAPEHFWESHNKHKTISGYTTTYNCLKQSYPIEECVRSLLGFCDEVIVVDGGSTDGTIEKLHELQKEFEQLVVTNKPRNWTDPGFSLFDGQQKAFARSQCTGDFCWQSDCDEVVHEDDYAKIRNLIEHFPKGVPMVSLPVIEYWGGHDKVRLDVTPWKWRLSRNSPRITHGVPKALQSIARDGRPCAKEGTDGCDLIDIETAEPIQHIGFYTDRAHALRMGALEGNKKAIEGYEQWFSEIVHNLPSVHHYSWFDIERKIKLYGQQGYGWSKHWNDLYDKTIDDTSENNMFFDKPWSEVKDEDIKELAQKLATQTGGHIWHKKWDGHQTPHLVSSVKPPKLMTKEIK